MSEGAAPSGATGPDGPDAPPPLQGLLAAALEALRTRLELAAVELEIHLIGLARSLIWAVTAVFCALLGLAFGIVALIAALWSSHRVLGLLGGGLAFLVLALVCALIGARIFHRGRGILDDSLGQLQRDQRRAGGS